MATISRRLILVLAFSAACVRFGAAQVAVEVSPAGVSVGIPGGTGASGVAAPAPSMTLPSADFARNFAFQLDRAVLAPSHPQPLPVRLQGALQAQVDAGVPQRQAVATQSVLVQALSDPKVLAAIQGRLRETATPENPLLGRDAAVKLAGFAAAAQSMESRAELNRYTEELKNALAASIAGDDREFDHLFDGLLSRAPAAVSGTEDGREAAGGKIRMSLGKSKPENMAARGEGVPAPSEPERAGGTPSIIMKYGTTARAEPGDWFKLIGTPYGFQIAKPSLSGRVYGQKLDVLGELKEKGTLVPAIAVTNSGGRRESVVLDFGKSYTVQVLEKDAMGVGVKVPRGAKTTLYLDADRSYVVPVQPPATKKWTISEDSGGKHPIGTLQLDPGGVMVATLLPLAKTEAEKDAEDASSPLGALGLLSIAASSIWVGAAALLSLIPMRDHVVSAVSLILGVILALGVVGGTVATTIAAFKKK